MRRGAIFDQDGLIFDTERIFFTAWALAAEQMNFVLPEGFRTAVSGSSGETMQRIIEAWIPGIDSRSYMNLTYSISYTLQEKDLTEKPGLRDILGLFRERGVPMAVASSSHRSQVEHNLRRAGLLSFFDVLVTGEDLKRAKPDPDAFLTAAARLGLEPDECYVFEDSFNGVRAGHAAGCCTVMIPDLVRPTEEIASLCNACFPDLGAAAQAIRAGLL